LNKSKNLKELLRKILEKSGKQSVSICIMTLVIRNAGRGLDEQPTKLLGITCVG